MAEQPTQHTSEPWRLGRNGSIVCDTPYGRDSGHDDVDYYGGHAICESLRSEADGRRIVACVNALAGHDPENVKQLLTTHGKLLEGCKHFVKWAERLRDDGVCPVPIGLSLVKDVIAEIDAPEDTPQ